MHLQDLPEELLIRIFSLLESSRNSSSKEIQRDLSSIATSHSFFLNASRLILYRNPTIRNSGRASLLFRAIDENEKLSILIRGLIVRSLDDSGSAPTMMAILARCPRIESIEMGSKLVLTLELGNHLYKIAENLSSFTFGASPQKFPHAFTNFLAKLLIFSKNLKTLQLENLFFPDLITLTPPLYKLNSLTLSNIIIEKSWLDWISGETKNLEKLHLCQIGFGGEAEDLVTFFQSLPNLKTLAWSNVVTNENNLESTLLNRILSNLPLLKTLTVDHTGSDKATLLSSLSNSKNLQSLTLIGRDLYMKSGLEEAIKKGSLVGLRSLSLFGPLNSDYNLVSLRNLVVQKRIEFYVSRIFT